MNCMKKKMMLCIIAICMLTALSGCIRLDIHFTVKANGKADVKMLYAVSDSMKEYMDDSEGLFDTEELKDNGFKISNYEEDGYTGFTAEAKNIDLKSLSGEGKGGDSFVDGVSVIKDRNKYSVSLDVWENEELQENKGYFGMIESAGGYMKLSLTTPVKADSHNATSVSEDGKTLTWNLFKMSEEACRAEFTLSKGKLFLLIIPVVILIGVVAVLVKRKKTR